MAGAFGFKGCQKIRGAQIRGLLEAKDFFLFDCDGVIWHGENAITGAATVVNSLIRRGKNVVFVTNNCTRPRENYVHKFSRLGFTDVMLEQIFSSSYCSALYLRDVVKVHGQVFVVGCEGLRRELLEAGVPCVEEADDDPDATIYNCALAADVKAVLVGHDDKLTFLKLAKATCYLRDPECLFLATDNDPWHPLSGGRILPGDAQGSFSRSTAQLLVLLLNNQLHPEDHTAELCVPGFFYIFNLMQVLSDAGADIEF